MQKKYTEVGKQMPQDKITIRRSFTDTLIDDKFSVFIITVIWNRIRNLSLELIVTWITNMQRINDF